MEDHTLDQKLNKRIAIIGAGAAGLTAAETLRQMGYTRVTIFEHSNRVGGKCLTQEIDGRLYELGAGVISGNNKTVFALAKRFEVPLERVVFGKSILVDSESGEVLKKKTIRQLGRLLYELIKYKKLLARFSSLSKQGFIQIDPELSQPFSIFAKTHRIELLAAEFALFFTGFGYGYLSEIPAAHVLKYYSRDTLLSFIKRQIYFFPTGIQSLWTAVAKKQDVRLDVKISHIERGDKITIHTEQESQEFDELILTSPLDETSQFLDQTSEEHALFSKILYVDYRTIVCSVSGIKKMSGYVPANFYPSRPGQPVFWNHRHPDSDIYTFYVLEDGSMTHDVVEQNVRALIEKMGGVLNRVHAIQQWKYFPHVSPAEMAEGYFDRLSALQGIRHTYYAGELLNFSTVGLTSAYAEDLIKRFF